MPLPLRTVTFDITRFTGEEFAEGDTFVRITPTANTTVDGIIVPAIMEQLAPDEDGQGSFQAVPGDLGTPEFDYTAVFVRRRDGGLSPYQELNLGRFRVPTGTGPFELADLLADGVPPAATSYWRAITEAQYNEVIAAVDLVEAARDATIDAAARLYDDTAAMLADETAWPDGTVLSVRGIGDYEVVPSEPDLSNTELAAPKLLRSVSPQAVFRPEAFEDEASLSDYGLQKALYAAMRAFDDDRPATVLLPSREIVCSAPLDPIERPIAIRGQGWSQSFLRLVGDNFSLEDAFMRPRHVGFGPENANDFPRFGNVSYVSPATKRSGLSLEGFQITGDRAHAQYGIVFEGNCDNVSVRDVMITYLRGNGMRLGGTVPGDTVRGNVRESHFSNVMIRRCGDRTDSVASLLIYRDPLNTGGQADACNMNEFDRCQVVYPQGHGVHIFAPDGAGAGAVPINAINFSGLILHDQMGTDSPDLTTNGDLFRVEGDVAGVTGYIQPVKQQVADRYCVNVLENGTRRPLGVSLRLKMQDVVNGVRIGNVQQVKLEMDRPYARRILVDHQDTNGTAEIIVNNDVNFLQANAAVVLSGTTPVTVDFSQYGAGEISAFFQGAATVRVALDGRLGDLTNTAGVFTFTPDASSSLRYRPAAAIFSKVLVPASRYNRVSGSWAGFARSPQRTRNLDLSDAILPWRRRFTMRVDDLDTSSGKGAWFHTDNASGLVTFGVNDGTTDTGIFYAFPDDTTKRLVMLSALQTGPLFNDAGKLRIGNRRIFLNEANNVLMFKDSEPASATDGVALQTNRNGTTAARPSSPLLAQQYFDTTLGKPIWWNGAAWVDATGTTV